MKKYIILLISFYSINAQSSSDLFSDLTFRNIGPSVAGGRIHDVEVMPGNPEMLFIASASEEYGNQQTKAQPGSLYLIMRRYPLLEISRYQNQTPIFYM